MREGAPGTKISWSLEGKLVAARKGHRSQGTPASHEQRRFTAGICCAGNIQHSSRVAPLQYCSSRVVKHRAAPLMRAAVVRLPLGSTSRGSPPNVSRHGTVRYCGTHTVQPRLRSPYYAFTPDFSANLFGAHRSLRSPRGVEKPRGFGHRSQGTPASHEQGRLVAGI